MKLYRILEGRKNVAYKRAVISGTEKLYDQNNIIIRKLTTPEALQHWSKQSCPGWYRPNAEPPCTVVWENAIHHLKDGPIYYCEQNGKPI